MRAHGTALPGARMPDDSQTMTRFHALLAFAMLAGAACGVYTLVECALWLTRSPKPADAASYCSPSALQVCAAFTASTAQVAGVWHLYLHVWNVWDGTAANGLSHAITFAGIGSSWSGTAVLVSARFNGNSVGWALGKLNNNVVGAELDFAAGTHYTNVYEQLTLDPNPVAIHQASQQFVDDIAEDLRHRLDQDISKSEFVEILKSTIAEHIANRIGNVLDRFENKPSIPIGPLGGRIRQEVAQVVERFIEAKQTALRIRIDALHLTGAARRAAVNRMVNAAKMQIADQLASVLDRKLDRTISQNDFWFDPYVGLRTRYNFNKTYYTGVRGEIGGFGVGADLMWEVEAVVGINLTRSIFTEIGYRALGGNFEENNFRFETVMHGPQITTGITF